VSDSFWQNQQENQAVADFRPINLAKTFEEILPSFELTIFFLGQNDQDLASDTRYQ